MNARFITQIEEFEAIADRWDEAVIKSGVENPFLLADLILSWWRYYSEKRKLLIFVVDNGGSIMAGIPLCIEKDLLRRTVKYIGGPAANLTHCFSLDKEINVFEKLMELLSSRRDWDNLIFQRVISGDALIKELTDIPWDRYGGFGYSLSNSGLNASVGLSNGYDGVFNRLSGRLKRYIRNGRQEAGHLGELKLHRIMGSAGVRKLFEEYRNISIRSYRHRDNMSAFEDEACSNFYKDLLDVFERKGRLDAHSLKAGDYTLGISFGYRFGSGFKWILTAYNPDFYKIRPGHLLLDYLIRYAVEKGDLYFDMFYGGELFYKQQWCNQLVPLKKIEVYRGSLVNKLILHIEDTLRSSRIFMFVVRRAKRLLNNYKAKFRRSDEQ